MRIKFRQGIVRYQTDITNNPQFLQVTPTGVTLNVSPDPTLVTFAHGQNTDYLFEELLTITDAWTGPFSSPTDYWLYWDLDVITGERTFGHTVVDPVASTVEPQSPALDQHWFDNTKNIMFVRIGNRWVEKIRVFAGKLSTGVVLIQNTIGTQSGVNVDTDAGFLIFDDEDRAVKKFNRAGRGKFITTESRLSTQVSKLANFRIEAGLVDGEAIEHIPELYCVAFRGPHRIGLASYATPQYPAIGIVLEDLFTGEVRSIITAGHVSSELWNWVEPSGTKLFVGISGQITTTVPPSGSIQNIGSIVNKNTILLNIRHIVILD